MVSISKTQTRVKSPAAFDYFPLIAPGNRAIEALAEHLDSVAEGCREARKNPDPRIAAFYQALRDRTGRTAMALFDLHELLQGKEVAK